jgi:non-ribosomal peptide synthetase component F
MAAAVQWAVPSSHPLDLDLPSGRTFEQLPEEWVDRPVPDILAEVVTHFPNRLAIDDGIRRLSYEDFWNEFRAVAEQVLAVARPGPVGVLLPSSASFLVAVLACLAVRRVCIPLDLNTRSSAMHASCAPPAWPRSSPTRAPCRAGSTCLRSWRGSGTGPAALHH